jgi:hypothetical protein
MNKKIFLLFLIPIFLALAATFTSAEHRIAYNVDSYYDGYYQSAYYTNNNWDYRVRTYYSNAPYVRRAHYVSYPVYTAYVAPSVTVWDYQRPYRHYDYDYYQVYHKSYPSRYSNTGYKYVNSYYY